MVDGGGTQDGVPSLSTWAHARAALVLRTEGVSVALRWVAGAKAIQVSETRRRSKRGRWGLIEAHGDEVSVEKINVEITGGAGAGPCLLSEARARSGKRNWAFREYYTSTRMAVALLQRTANVEAFRLFLSDIFAFNLHRLHSFLRSLCLATSSFLQSMVKPRGTMAATT